MRQMCAMNRPAHVTEGLEDRQAVPFVNPKKSVMQDEQLPTVHELTGHSHPSLRAHRQMICNQSTPVDGCSATRLDDTQDRVQTFLCW